MPSEPVKSSCTRLSGQIVSFDRFQDLLDSLQVDASSKAAGA